MQIHDIKKPKHLKGKKRVGRGGKRGTYSGKGMKGQKSRAGKRIRPQIWDYITKIPKLSGPTAKTEGARTPAAKSQGRNGGNVERILNVGDLNNVSKNGDVINIQYLLKTRLVKKYKGRTPRVKLLGNGDLKKQITVEGLQISKGAEEKIKKAGGTVKTK